nr:hypothetical protein [Tanacetum cinerariifolium]
EVVVDEVCKWDYTTTSVIRLPPDDIQALSGCYMILSSIHRSCSNHDLELEVSSAEETIQDAEKFEQEVDLLHMFQTLDVKVLQSKR